MPKVSISISLTQGTLDRLKVYAAEQRIPVSVSAAAESIIASYLKTDEENTVETLAQFAKPVIKPATPKSGPFQRPAFNRFQSQEASHNVG